MHLNALPRSSRWSLAAGIAFSVWLTALSSSDAADPLRIRVTPAIAQPPAFVTIRADVDAHDDNRALEITAESESFYTSSRVPLEGAKGPRFSEVHFDNLPEGRYTVKVVLLGTQGTRAAATRVVLVGTPTSDDAI